MYDPFEVKIRMEPSDKDMTKDTPVTSIIEATQDESVAARAYLI